MTLYLKQYLTQNISKILSWTDKSGELLNAPTVVEWCGNVPNCSTFRVNTISYTTEDVLLYFQEKFAKLFENENNQLPNVRLHEIIPECIIIDKIKVDNITPKYLEVIVDSYCGASVLRGSDVFAPGVVGMSPNVFVDTEVSVYADLSHRCLKGFKNKYEDEGKLFLGNGTALMNRHQLFDGGDPVRGTAVKITSTVSGIVTYNYHKNMGILQNLPSMVCVQVLDPKPYENVLDMCAAPGNKTTHIAALMEDKGTLVAIDKKTKICQISEKCNYMNVHKCIKIFAGDSRNLIGELNRSILIGPPFSPNKFDKILLDAPCSGLGNRPVFRTLNSKQLIQSFPKIQKKLFENAVSLLKPGGILVYSTCSILCEENECVIAWVLRTYPEMELISSTPLVGGPGLPQCGLTEEQRTLVQRFGPGTETDDFIGFFIAKLKKKKVK